MYNFTWFVYVFQYLNVFYIFFFDIIYLYCLSPIRSKLYFILFCHTAYSIKYITFFVLAFYAIIYMMCTLDMYKYSDNMFIIKHGKRWLKWISLLRVSAYMRRWCTKMTILVRPTFFTLWSLFSGMFPLIQMTLRLPPLLRLKVAGLSHSRDLCCIQVYCLLQPSCNNNGYHLSLAHGQLLVIFQFKRLLINFHD